MKISITEMENRRHRARESLNLHEIEGNPLTPEEIAMFEMFDREGFTDEQCRAYLLEYVKERSRLSEPAE